MKKFIIRLSLLVAALLGIEIANNVVLLRLHPMGFYYTPAGLLFTTIVISIEAIAMYPVVAWQIRKLEEEWSRFLS
jgi:hypothetical protein